MPAPADRVFVLQSWPDEPRVRVRMPVGNWYENRPITLLGPRRHRDIKFHPAWGEGNIDLEVAIECQGYCDLAELPSQIVKTARDEFAALRDDGLVPRWIVKPHRAGGVWSWRFDATDNGGTRVAGHVAVVRIIPELEAYLSCRGETTYRGNPIWLDRIEALCRELRYEVLP